MKTPEKPRKLFQFTVEMQAFGTDAKDAWKNVCSEPENFIPYADCMPNYEEVPEEQW